MATSTKSFTDPHISYVVDILKNTCTCKSWKYQRKPNNQRDCKHLIQLRGHRLEVTPNNILTYPSKKTTTFPFQLISSTIPKRLNQTITSYMWSIKHDGIRVALDSSSLGGRTRAGLYVTHFPSSSSVVLPKNNIYDTELIYVDDKEGTKSNHDLVWKVLNEGKTEHLQYRIFGILEIDGNSTNEWTFEKRYEYICDHIPESLLVRQEFCETWPQLQFELKTVLENNGEGLVVRSRHGLYLGGKRKNTNAFKMKSL